MGEAASKYMEKQTWEAVSLAHLQGHLFWRMEIFQEVPNSFLTMPLPDDSSGYFCAGYETLAVIFFFSYKGEMAPDCFSFFKKNT